MESCTHTWETNFASLLITKWFASAHGAAILVLIQLFTGGWLRGNRSAKFRSVLIVVKVTSQFWHIEDMNQHKIQYRTNKNSSALNG